MQVIDGATGEVIEVQLFVAVLGASSYTYAEATWTQGLADWIGSHVRTFAFIGGVTAQTVSDNLKSGITKACFYEPTVNRTYAEMAAHYDTAIVPARPYKPRDKAKVEVAVLVATRWIIAKLRKRTFFSLAELNAAIAIEVAALNARVTRHLGASRKALFEELERVFRDYGESGTGTTRHYVHDDDEAKLYGAEPGTFTQWGPLPEKSDLLFYEGLHGAVVTENVNIAQYADLKIGVVPVINLEWIQKLHRDRSDRGYSAEAVTDTILRRMPDYVNYICPQFADTDINFQRVPTVDTSNPFIARWIPTPDESMVVIRLKNPRGIDFPYLLSMIPNSFMSRANSIVIHGSKLDLAMQLILTPLILQLMERKRRTV
jgi:phosphoribulokinase